MPLNLTIICPYHEKEEKLNLPDDYKDDFSGEVPCGADGEDKATLNIKLKFAKVEELTLKQAPPAY